MTDSEKNRAVPVSREVLEELQRDAARWWHCEKHGWPSEVGLVHGGNTWRAPDARGLWWAGNTAGEAVDAAIKAGL